VNLLFVNQKLGYQSTTTYSYELARALHARGHRVKMCTTGGELRDWFHQGGIDILPVKFNYFSFRRLMRFLSEHDPDLIHIQNLRSLPLGHRLSERLHRPHLVTVHHVPGGLSAELPHFLLTAVIAVNEDIRESLVNDHRIQKDLIRVIPHGINLDRFVPQAEAPWTGRGRLPVVGTIGRLDPLKGFHYFLSAARKVLNRGLEAMFVIVGEGEEERHLRQEAKDLQIEKFVTFAPPMPDLVDLYRSFDVVVVPTQRGGVGLTALEAMAMARPVVGTALGFQGLSATPSDGIRVADDPEGMAREIVAILTHPDDARDMGRRARAYVERAHRWDAHVAALESMLDEVRSDRATRGGALAEGDLPAATGA